MVPAVGGEEGMVEGVFDLQHVCIKSCDVCSSGLAGRCFEHGATAINHCHPKEAFAQCSIALSVEQTLRACFEKDRE